MFSVLVMSKLDKIKPQEYLKEHLLSSPLSHMANNEYLNAGSYDRLNIIWVSGMVVRLRTLIGCNFLRLPWILFGILVAYLMRSSIFPKDSMNSKFIGFSECPLYL